MNNIIEKVREELIKRCEEYNQKYDYDFWNEHIKYVVSNSLNLAKEYGGDLEIVELGALLHDIAMPSEYGPKEEHHIYGAEIAEKILKELNYPEEKIEHVKRCVLNHRGSKDMPRTSIEEECIADADVIAHFDCIPMLFHLAFREKQLNVAEGKEFIKNKLEKDYQKLSDRSKELLKDRYENIMKVLFI